MQDSLAVLSILIPVYAIAVVLNALISALLFVRQRDPLTRAQLLIWVAALAALVVQGGLGVEMPLVLVGLTSVFGVSCAIAKLLSIIGDIEVRWKMSIALLAACWLTSGSAILLGLPFVVVTAPIVLGVAWPLLVTSVTLLVRRHRTLSTAELGMGVASLIYGLHMLDFAWLGDKPAVEPFGFSVGLLCIFALSIFGPAVVVEKISAATARTAAEMDAARRLQTELLPQSPTLPGLDLCCFMRPADEVGGDYYDIQRTGDRAWILLGDVTGHGLSSGIVMLMAQSIMSTILHTRPAISPGELNLLANSILRENLVRMGEERTMTIAALCLESADEFVLSGSHDDLYIYRAATGEVEVVEVSQFPFQLGLTDDVPAEFVTEARFALAPGDTIFLITDGVTEAARGGEYAAGMFDESRVIALIKAHVGAPLETIRDALNAELDLFTAGVYHDDVTFVIARRQGTPA